MEISFSTLSYFGINSNYLSYLAGTSVIYLVLLFITSYVFQYCYLYRISLFAIGFVNILAWYDSEIGIPLDDLNMLRVYLVILLIGVISFIKFKVNDARHNRDFVG